MPEKLLCPSYGLSNSDLQRATAVESQVLQGQTFYSGNKNIRIGSMKSHGDGTECNSIGIDGNNIYVRIDPGAYLQTAPSSGYPEIICNIDSVRDVIGINITGVFAGRIKYGGIGPEGFSGNGARVSSNNVIATVSSYFSWIVLNQHDPNQGSYYFGWVNAGATIYSCPSGSSVLVMRFY